MFQTVPSHGLLAATHRLPPSAFHAAETADTDARLPWPEGFSIVPTPCKADVVNKSTATVDGEPNLFVLVMGPGYPKIVGRGLWLAKPTCDHRALELPLAAYSIQFHKSKLLEAGVTFEPAWAPVPPTLTPPQSPYGTSDVDFLRAANIVPAAPIASILCFYQRKRMTMTMTMTMAGPAPANRTRRSRSRHTGIPKPDPIAHDAARHEGCLGILRVASPMPSLLLHERPAAGCQVVLYCRVAFDSRVLTLPPSDQGACVWTAARAAMAAAPYPDMLVAEMLPSACCAPVSEAAPLLTSGDVVVPGFSPCPPALWLQAPAGAAWGLHTPVVVLPVVVTLHQPLASAPCPRVRGDVLTRFMYDMMLADPGLAIMPEAAHMRLRLFTNKTPGLLDVSCALRGVPLVEQKSTKARTSRDMQDVHPAMVVRSVDAVPPGEVPVLPEAPVPALSAEDLEANPLVGSLLTPAPTPLTLRGLETSIYDPEDGTPMLPGTLNAWGVKGAAVWSMIMTPKDPVHYPWGLWGPHVSPAQRRAALDFLFPSDYNTAALEVFSAHGRWRQAGVTRRAFVRPYALHNEMLHDAMWWSQVYPAFVQDWTRPHAHVPPTPANLPVWSMVVLAGAVLDFLARYGRIVRPLLNRRNRKIRVDYNKSLQTYVCLTGSRVHERHAGEGLVANTALVLLDVFGPHLELGSTREDQRSRADQVFSAAERKETPRPAPARKTLPCIKSTPFSRRKLPQTVSSANCDLEDL